MGFKKFRKRIWKRARRALDWVLPPNVQRWFQRTFMEQRTARGLHRSPNRFPRGVELFWEGMNGEFRPAFPAAKPLDITIAREAPFPWVQFGIGVNDATHRWNTVEISVNGVRKGVVDRIGVVNRDNPRGQWHDVRIPLDAPMRDVRLTITPVGSGSRSVSDPIASAPVNIVPASSRRATTIVCIIVDGIADDTLTDATVPFTGAFFRDGVRCDQVFAQGDWTLPSFSSMLTGCYPSRHGVNHPSADVFLPTDMETLPEILLRHGYRTFGYSGHGRFAIRYGHARGFERFCYRPIDYVHSYSDAINEAIGHLEAHRGESNFVLLHLFDTHFPFSPHSYVQTIHAPPVRSMDVRFDTFRFTDYQRWYDYSLPVKLRAVDRHLQALYSFLDAAFDRDTTAVILTSDHGMPIKKEGKPLLLQHRVHIPLLVRGASLSAQRMSALIEGSVDLFPSILHLAGVQDAPQRDGQRWPFLNGGMARETAVSESLYGRTYSVAVRSAEWCTHAQCPYDHATRTIDASSPTTVSYRRVNGVDREDAEARGVSADGPTPGHRAAFDAALERVRHRSPRTAERPSPSPIR